MGRLLNLVDDHLDLVVHVHGDRGAFGQVAADHAVPVPVASAPPGAVGVGEVGEHAQGLDERAVRGELAAVVHRHADPVCVHLNVDGFVTFSGQSWRSFWTVWSVAE